jgi:hypothetical protein
MAATLFPALSPGATGKLAAGKGRERHTGHEKSRRNHERDHHFTHVDLSPYGV